MKYAFLALLSVTAVASAGSAAMIPMEQVGPQSRPVLGYENVVRVSPTGEVKTIAAALDSLKDASAKKRYAVLVAAGTYNESGVRMKPFVDLYGGFPADGGDGKARDVFANRTILDAQQKNSPVVIGADDARLDGFVITGGRHNAHGAGILCDGVSPTIVNNVITANQTLKPEMKEGVGKQVANEGAGVALLNGSGAYVANNLICDNSTEIGAGAGVTVRGKVDDAKILRNVFANNTAGLKDNAQFHGKEGSRSSPGAAIAVNDESSPQISFNVLVLGQAIYRNDAGGIWVEGNSRPLINHNWVVGNTAYDDGGGIYCMGALYYDEAGDRHDAAPDGPVRIEDNLIVGNHTVHGGPGGVRVSRWGRAELRRNRLIANTRGAAFGAEGGVIAVFEDNIVEGNGQLRADGDDVTPKFRFSGGIAGRAFDADRFVTRFTTDESIGDDEGYAMEGAAVRVGRQWSVVRSAGPDGLVVWGNVTDASKTFEVLEEYLPDDSAVNRTPKRRERK